MATKCSNNQYSMPNRSNMSKCSNMPQCSVPQCSMRCDDSCFKKPKSYSEVLKEHRDLLSEHFELMKEQQKANQIIESLRSLNATLMEKIKEKEEQNKKVEDKCQIFLRTYTNMSIEMLKLEEKLAKYEGRVF